LKQTLKITGLVLTSLFVLLVGIPLENQLVYADQRTKTITEYWTSGWVNRTSEVSEPTSIKGSYYDSESGQNVNYTASKSGGLYEVDHKIDWKYYTSYGRASNYDKKGNNYLGYMSNNSKSYYRGNWSDSTPAKPNDFYGDPFYLGLYDWKLVDRGWDDSKVVNADTYAKKGSTYRNKLVYSNGSYWWRSEKGILNKYRRGVWLKYSVKINQFKYRQKYQVTITLPDNTPPEHIEHSMKNYTYKNGEYYWVKPNESVNISLRQYDLESGNKHQYLRLVNDEQDIRKRHDFYDGVTDINGVSYGFDSPYLTINSASRLENTSYGKVRWNVTPKRHGDSYDIQYYYQDIADNSLGYNNTGMKLNVDGEAPRHNAPMIYGERYESDGIYWYKPNDLFSIQISSLEKESGHYRSYLKLEGDGNDNRAFHQWDSDTPVDEIDEFMSGEYTEFISGESPYFGWTAKYKFTLKAKSNAHGRVFSVYTAYRDNVMNFRNYIDSDKKIAVDGEGPSVSFSPNSKAWTNKDIPVEANITDDDSGVNRIRYKVYHDGTWSSYTDWMSVSSEDFSFTEDGVYRIYLEAEDNVGNKTTTYSGYYHVDKTNPNFTANAITGYDYKDGNNYWIKPSSPLNIRFRGYDYRSRITLSYLRLLGTSEVRSQHNWLESSIHLNNYMTSPYVSVNAVSESYESADDRYREVTFNTNFNTHGQNYTVYGLKRDAATNWSDNYVWYNTEKVIRTDGLPPELISSSVTGAKYVQNNTYWVNSNDTLSVTIQQEDQHSGNRYQNLRLYGSGIDARANHNYTQADDYISRFKEDNYVNFVSAQNTVDDGATQAVQWQVQAENHGNSYELMTHIGDFVKNEAGYLSLDKTVAIDDVAPTIAFRNKADTTSFTSRDWHNTAIDVRLKFRDPHSGYKRSRYAWTLSNQVPSESEWSQWQSSANYVITKDTAGEWYLHVQTEDNVGNTRYEVKGKYLYNQPPVAGFEFDSSTYYIGDEMSITSIAYDPDGHDITHLYEVTRPDGRVDTFTTPDFTYTPDIPGNYTFKQTVTDTIGDSDSISAMVYVRDLSLTGHVKHTDEWLEKHLQAGNALNMFYSGEKFILEADVTAYPVDYVTVDFKGTQNNGNTFTQQVPLVKQSSTLYKGAIFDEQFSIGDTTLKQGPVSFEFNVRYTNGIEKTDTVIVDIIGSSFNYFKFHRRY
jgi:hypothetical protein